MHIQTITKGAILIARPSLLSDIFHRSVVLITDHSEHTGSIGFVLNKPLDLPINEFLGDINSDAIVYEGGPVDQENIFYIHTRPDLIKDSEQITDELYWSGNYDDVKYAINNGYINDDEIRFYLGYSGWAHEQLTSEFKRKAWNLKNKITFNFFDTWDHDLWKKEMRTLGGENLLWMNMPENPSLN